MVRILEFGPQIWYCYKGNIYYYTYALLGVGFTEKR